MDAALIDRVRVRDPAAILELRQILFPRLAAVCTHVLKDPALAEEIAEDVWMDFVFDSIQRVEQPEAIGTYLRVMAVRRCVRVRERRMRHEELGERSRAGSDPEGEVISALDWPDRRLSLEACLGLLSARARQILRLRFHLDQTQETIGESLGFSKQYAGRVLKRSLEALRVCLEERS